MLLTPQVGGDVERVELGAGSRQVDVSFCAIGQNQKDELADLS